MKFTKPALTVILFLTIAMALDACNPTTATTNGAATITEPATTIEETTASTTAKPGGNMDSSSENVSHYPESIVLFEQYEYTDPETGYTIPYNLYLPEGYDESEQYPLVIFIGDQSVNSDTVTDPLQQDGAAVWASEEEQAKHKAIVLVPQYTSTLENSIGALVEDDYQWSEGLTLVSNLIFHVVEEYSVDENRIYGTGQSQGCMSTIAISDKYPDFYAAQLLVAGQWNAEEMSAMVDDHLWIIVSEGDNKAYPGMNEAVANWESLGASVATSDMWDSTVSDTEFDALVEATLSQGANINYTVFEGGNHRYTWSVAYTIEGIRDWLFDQTK
jgi:predicted peptidase